MENGYRKIWRDGLWDSNPAFAQLLGLCPLLAVTGSVVNGLGLGLATLLTLVVSNVTVSLIRRWVPDEVRIPVFVMVIAAAVTVIELLMAAYRYDLFKVLGVFLPLIVTNCIIIGRAEAFASKNSVDRALMDGLAMGVGFTIALVALGALREVVGQGTLFAQADLMFGDAGRAMTLTLIEDYRGFLLAVLPPGAFLGLGLLIAMKNVLDQRLRKRRIAAVVVAAPETSVAAG